MRRLILGDCRRVMKKLAEEGFRCDMILTDPPYNISNDAAVITRNGGKFGKAKPIAPKFDFDHTIEPEEWLPLAIELLKEDAVLVIFCADRQIPEYYRILERYGFKYMLSAWVKPNPTPQARKVKWCTGLEHFIIAYRGKHHYNYKAGMHPGYIIASSPRKRYHPTEKPQKVLREIIKWWSFPGDVILDPFAGSGSTGVAAVSLGRCFVGIEIDKEYFEVMKKRVPKLRPLPIYFTSGSQSLLAPARTKYYESSTSELALEKVDRAIGRGRFAERVLSLLKSPLMLQELYELLPEHSKPAIRGTVYRLMKKGVVKRVEKGRYIAIR